MISTLYTKSYWPYLGQAINQGLNGNGNLLAELAYEYEGLQNNGQFSNEEDANVAVNCIDSPSPRSSSSTRISPCSSPRRPPTSELPRHGAR